MRHGYIMGDCPRHGRVEFGSAWGGGCIECAKNRVLSPEARILLDILDSDAPADAIWDPEKDEEEAESPQVSADPPDN